MTWRAWTEDQLEAIERARRSRSVKTLEGRGMHFQLEGRPVVSFCSNDYLGLTQHPAVVAAAHEALDRYGAGSGSARLIAGARPVHAELEQALAAWKGQERALLFPTGYTANLGVLSAFGGSGVTILSDELNHASIIDGCRLARANVAVYRHNDLTHVKELLADLEHAIVVTDTVFSMDGDVAHVEGLAELCASHGALLVLDEAHAVLGPRPPRDAELLRVGTLSKAFGTIGGFVAGPSALVDLLVNRARPFIFTTAPTPADSAAALAALQVMQSAEGAALFRRLRRNIDRVRPVHPSPIIPLVLGDEERALAASQHLLDQGLLVPAIRPPTVAPGTSRLRVTVSAAHTAADLDLLLEALIGVA